jgi:hypothetical protein
LGTKFKEASIEASMCPLTEEASWKTS